MRGGRLIAVAETLLVPKVSVALLIKRPLRLAIHVDIHRQLPRRWKVGCGLNEQRRGGDGGVAS